MPVKKKKSTTSKKKKVYYVPGQSEHTLQCEVIEWCNHMAGIEKRLEYPAEDFGTIPLLEWIYHCPNGSHKSKIAAVKFKKAGLKSGVPDLFLPVPRFHRVEGAPHNMGAVRCGLFIEMKKPGGTTTKNQDICRAPAEEISAELRPELCRYQL